MKSSRKRNEYDRWESYEIHEVDEVTLASILQRALASVPMIRRSAYRGRTVVGETWSGKTVRFTVGKFGRRRK